MKREPYAAIRRLRALTRSEVAALPLEDLQTLRDELDDWADRVSEHLDERFQACEVLDVDALVKERTK